MPSKCRSSGLMDLWGLESWGAGLCHTHLGWSQHFSLAVSCCQPSCASPAVPDHLSPAQVLPYPSLRGQESELCAPRGLEKPRCCCRLCKDCSLAALLYSDCSGSGWSTDSLHTLSMALLLSAFLHTQPRLFLTCWRKGHVGLLHPGSRSLSAVPSLAQLSLKPEIAQHQAA